MNDWSDRSERTFPLFQIRLIKEYLRLVISIYLLFLSWSVVV